MAPFVGEAGELGRRRAEIRLHDTVSPPLESSYEISILQPNEQSNFKHYNYLAVSELRGLIASTVQRGARAVATALAFQRATGNNRERP